MIEFDEYGEFIPEQFSDEDTLKDCLNGIVKNIFLIRGMMYSPEIRQEFKDYFDDAELERYQDRFSEMLKLK